MARVMDMVDTEVMEDMVIMEKRFADAVAEADAEPGYYGGCGYGGYGGYSSYGREYGYYRKRSAVADAEVWSKSKKNLIFKCCDLNFQLPLSCISKVQHSMFNVQWPMSSTI